MILLSLVISLALCYVAYKLTFQSRNIPPGPWNLPLVGYLPFLGPRPYLTLRQLSEKYGDLFTIKLGGYPAIVLSSYELVKDALKEDNFTGRPPLPFFKFRSNNKGILFSDGHTWHEVRRFTLRHLRDFGFGKSSLERVIQEEIRELAESYKCNVGKPIRLQNTFNLAVLNALWTIVTGKRFDLEDPKAKRTIEELTQNIGEGAAVQLTQLIPVVHALKGIPKKVINFVNDTKLMLKDIVKEHEEVHKEGDASDFMHVFLDKKQQDEKQGMRTPFTGEDGMANLLVSTLDLFAAGSETTSTTLLWVFLLLATHPDIQEKVQDELDRVVGRDRLPSTDDKPSLPYTEAVLMECQRFASLVPLGAAHYSTANTKFKGYDIPKGTIIVPNLYQVLHDPKTWEKPDEFYPEHFLTKDGQVKHMEQFIPFATGKRVCIGESLAKIELFLFATALLQQFKFELPVNQPKPSLIPPPSIVLSPAPYDVILTLRT